MLLVLCIILFVASSFHACPSPSGSETRRETSASTTHSIVVISQEEETAHFSSTKLTTAKKRTTSKTSSTITTFGTQTKRSYLDFNRFSHNCIDDSYALHSIIVSFIFERF